MVSRHGLETATIAADGREKAFDRALDTPAARADARGRGFHCGERGRQDLCAKHRVVPSAQTVAHCALRQRHDQQIEEHDRNAR